MVNKIREIGEVKSCYYLFW